ncbi:MAG: acyl-CoA dehydrogenase family protein [Coriobacteriales bacterium]
MDFKLTQEQEQLVATVRAFGQAHFDPVDVRQWRRDGGLPDEVVRDFVNLDFGPFGIIRPDAQGRYDLVAQTLVLEELARCSGATLPFSNDFLNLQIMEAFDGEGAFDFVRQRYQEEGRLAFALAITEPEGGSDVMSMHTETRSQDGKVILTGKKTFVNNGEFAPYLLVAAVDQDAPQGKYPEVSLWLVPNGLPGIEVYPIAKIGQSMLPFSYVVLNRVRLEEQYRLRGSEAGIKQLFHFFEIGRLNSCATALGLAQAAMEDAVAYAASRNAFGSRVADFQIIEQMLVDMQVKLDNMRSQVYRVATLLQEEGESRSTRMAGALMKRYVPKTATEVASDALQIFGGKGYTTSARVSSIWEDCRGFQIAEGTDQIMVRIAAPLIMEHYQA